MSLRVIWQYMDWSVTNEKKYMDLRSFGPYNIFLLTDRSMYCHMTLSAMNYLLYIYTVKPRFIAPRFTIKLVYGQEFLQSRFPYVVITLLKCQTRIPPSATVM
jgi:hypothetical protein